MNAAKPSSTSPAAGRPAQPTRAERPTDLNLPRLTALRPGQAATVRALDQGLRRDNRRRLLDLGLTPGTTVIAVRSGPFRDPVAYRIRGTLIALRRDQAHCVLIIT